MMPNYIYETHIMENTLLPFIFHRGLTAEQDSHFSLNWHENIEILRCTAGSGLVKCNQEVFAVSQGELFVVNSDAVHSTGSSGRFEYDCLIVDRGFCQSNGILITALHFQEVIRDEGLLCAFDRVAKGFEKRPEAVWEIGQLRYDVLGLLILLCRDYAVALPQEAKKSVSAERVKRAVSYIRRNLTDPITLDALAEAVGISKYQLSREFKALTGETVIDFVNILRCKEAKQLIQGGMSVSAAARTCGFENLSYFTRTFKKHFGTVPSAFLAG